MGLYGWQGFHGGNPRSPLPKDAHCIALVESNSARPNRMPGPVHGERLHVARNIRRSANERYKSYLFRLAFDFGLSYFPAGNRASTFPFPQICQVV
jgi:hypothetical protein